MSQFLQVLLSGLATGSIYALAAIGFTLVWQAAQTVNFAQGEFVMVPAFFVLVGLNFLGMPLPVALSGTFEILPGAPYPIYRLLILVAGVGLAGGLYLLINRTRVGMLIRAGASNREMVQALGVDIGRLYTLLFALGAALAGLAGALAAPLVSVEVGMGESVLILTFVVIVIGGIGSIRGALAGALLVGLVDTLGRAYLPTLLALLLPPAQAQGIGSALASMSVYLLMAAVLVARPRGLFPVNA